jgi:hypothetical protein
MSQVRRFDIGEYVVVAGLSWHAFRDQKDLNKSFVMVGKKFFNASFAVKRTGRGYFNAGYLPIDAEASIGDKKSLPKVVSLVAAIAAELPVADCVCAFDIPGTSDMLLLEMVAGSIDPEFGDIVGTEEEIRLQFIERARSSGSDALYAPARWNVVKAVDVGQTDEFFARVLSKTNVRESLLAPTKKALPWPLFATVLVLSGGGLAGWKVYDSIKQQELEAARRAAAEAVAKRIADASAVNVAKAEIRPWFEKPIPSEFLAACSPVFADSKYESIRGWSLGDAECTGTGVRLKFVRTKNGIVRSMVDAVPTAAVSLDGQNAVVSVDYAAKLASSQDAAVPTAELVRRFLSAWQSVGVQVALVEVIPPQPSPPPKDPPPTLFKTYKWTAVSKHRPSTLLPVIDFPSVRIESVKVKFTEDGTAEYSIEGLVYGV